VSLLLAFEPTRANTGSLAATLAGVTLAAAATIPVIGSASVTLDGLVAFPSVIDITTSGPLSAPSGTVSLPGSLTVGQRLIAIAAGNFATVTWPSGWTRFVSGGGSGGAGSAGVSAAYHDVDGTEGASITITLVALDEAVCSVYRLAGCAATAPEGTSVVIGTSVNPNAGSLTASWGSDKNLFITAMGGLVTGGNTLTSYPSGYALSQSFAVPANAYLGVACRQVSGATDDAPAWTLGTSDTWAAATIVVRGGSIGSGVVPVGGSAALSFAGATLSGAGSVPVTGAMSAQLSDLTLSGDAAATGGGGGGAPIIGSFPAPSWESMGALGFGWEKLKPLPHPVDKQFRDTQKRLNPTASLKRVRKVARGPSRGATIELDGGDDEDLMAVILAVLALEDDGDG
jgi:hypothetical protein